MKTAEQMFISVYGNVPPDNLDALKVVALMLAYGEQVKEECIRVAQPYGGTGVADSIRALKLP